MGKIQDFQLLLALNSNCRQTAKELAKSGISAQSIGPKIDNFLQRGIIREFTTVINSKAFGAQLYRIILFFQNISQNEYESVLQYIIKDNKVARVKSLDINSGLSILFICYDYNELQSFIGNFKLRYGIYLTEHRIMGIQNWIEYPNAYLVNKAVDESGVKFSLKYEKGNLTKEDKKILFFIIRNARLSLVELHDYTQIPLRTIQYRIKHMISNGMILGFRAIINEQELGFRKFRLRFETNKEFADVKHFAQTNPNIVRFEEFSPADFEIDVVVESIDAFISLIDLIKERFSPLRSYNYNYIVKLLKYKPFMP